MLTMYRSKSTPPPSRSHELPLANALRNKLNTALIDIFTVDELMLLGPLNRTFLLHIMNDFIDNLQARAFPQGPELSESDICIVLRDNKWMLMDDLENMVNAASNQAQPQTTFKAGQ